jgi:hypothetical protein
MHKKKDKSKILERPLLENLREHINIYKKQKPNFFYGADTLPYLHRFFLGWKSP